jgi:hypothetical protein
MNASRVAVVVVSSLLAACAPRLTGWVTYTAPLPPSPTQTISELSRLRGLPLDAPIDIELVDDDTFLRAYHTTNSSPLRNRAYFRAFGMTTWADVGTMADRMMDEGLRGFYDFHTKRLYVRRVAQDRVSASAANSEPYTLAHEAEHALQDRFFAISAFESFENMDQALAWRALIEGDAMLAASLLELNRYGSAPTESIARIQKIAQAHGQSLLSAKPIGLAGDAPALLQAQLAWPYTRGVAFVAELAASGGWALVNAALRNPPKTTEQVLHIDKYIAGEGPIDVEVAAPVDGYTYVERGRMGELQTRFLLADCVTDAQAASAATGWGGDAYAVLARGAEQALLWNTAWDDEESATRFVTALEARKNCPRTGEKPPFTVVRDGARVAFVEGLADEAARAAVGRSLVGVIGRTPPAVPPLGPVHLSGRSAISSYFGDDGSGAGSVNSPIQIVSELANLRVGNLAGLDFYATGEYVTVGATVAWAPPSSAVNDASTNAFVHGLRKRLSVERVLDGGTRRFHLSWTDADQRAIRVGDILESRLTFAPTCDGRMTTVLITAWRPSTFGAETAAAWLASVKATATNDACNALKSLHNL